ncbi:MAG: Auxin Efflux Carrier [Firmicutes bacterium]|nr:Auxin Efflux Carrier [Bacillota bacterium]
MTFINSVESIISIILMIALGYTLTWKGWFNENTAKNFTFVVTKIALPAYMIWNLTSTFDKEKLLSMKSGLIIPFVSMTACYLLGYIISKVINITPSRQGIFRCMFFVSNTIFIGLPVNLALFGEPSVPYVLLYYMANTSLFWTLGVYAVSGDDDGERPKVLSFQAIRNFLPPPLIGFFIGVLLVLLEMKLPFFIMDTCKYLGNLTTPLSMLFIGISMYGVGLEDIKISSDMVGVILGRFVISPLIVFLIAALLPIPVLMKKVFIIQSAMPVVTQAAVIAKAYNSDYRYAAIMTTVTTILAMIMIPLYMVIFDHLAGV